MNLRTLRKADALAQAFFNCSDIHVHVCGLKDSLLSMVTPRILRLSVILTLVLSR